VDNRRRRKLSRWRNVHGQFTFRRRLASPIFLHESTGSRRASNFCYRDCKEQGQTLTVRLAKLGPGLRTSSLHPFSMAAWAAFCKKVR
jgi:hypothetical protein